MITKTTKGKLRMDLVRPEMMVALSMVLQHGAEKYGQETYLDEPTEIHKAALLRHLYRIALGEKIDRDSNLPHSWHVLTCAAIMVCIEEPEASWLLAEISGTDPKDRPWCDPKSDPIGRINDESKRLVPRRLKESER